MVFAALLQRLKATVQAIREWFAPRRQQPVDERFNDVVDMLERDAWLTGEMLDELREASRVAEGSPLHRSSQVDLAELVRSTTESFVSLARERNVSLRARCAASSVVIPADARDMTHIVSRLLACAIASSEAGGGVDCQLSVDAEWITLILHAHGVEDPSPTARRIPADLDRPAWQRFELLDVRKLVDLHGGIVRAELEGPRSCPVFTVILAGDPAIARQADRKTSAETGR
jgi:signal transduction histidine kinase